MEEKTSEAEVQNKTPSISYLISHSRDHCVDRLQEIYDSCIKASQKHQLYAYKSLDKHYRLAIPAVFVSAISNSISFIPIGGGYSEENTWIPISIAVITCINTILLSLLTLFKWETKSIQHSTASKNYFLLAHEIKDYMVKMPLESETWFNDLRNFTKRCEDIITDSPLLN